jgi:hypothetical protein
MTAEELSEFIEDVGVDRVVADLILRGYYVRQLAVEPTVPEDLVVTGTIRLLDALGLPLAGHGVTVETLRTAMPVTGVDGEIYHIGESQSKRYYELNAEGVLLLKLVKGARVMVTIEGAFTREFVVPEEDFSILAQRADDSFITPIAPISIPIRRT